MHFLINLFPLILILVGVNLHNQYYLTVKSQNPFYVAICCGETCIVTWNDQWSCRFLVSQGCIKPLCDLLTCPDARIVTVCLEGLDNILKVGEADKEMGLNGGVNIYAQMIDECEGLDKIEKLQTHDNNEIYEKAVKILERYWAEEEEENQNVQNGGDGNQQSFSFGSNQFNLPQGGFYFLTK